MIDFNVSRRAVLAGLAAIPFIPGVAHAGKVGKITRLDPALDAVIDVNAPIETLGTGYKWSEGPVWYRPGGFLLFSDVPSNTIHRWKAGEGVTPFMSPSGLAGEIPAGIREAGANGLAIDEAGQWAGAGYWGPDVSFFSLIMADSGTRAIARVDVATKKKVILADRFEGKRFNSCNDLAIAANGAIYFTDPPYGLAEGDTSPLRELDFNGVFRLGTDGRVTVIDRSLHRPNGVALSPDQRTLYVAMSDEKRPHILAYALGEDGGVIGEARILCDFSAELARKLPGLPDGLKVAKSGHLFVTAPGGVYVLTPQGKKLGLIATGKATANCAFGEDGKTLFLTSHDTLAKVRLKQSAW
jgi:gluconolactonase